MAQKLIIRQLLAGFLLLVFSFSVTPKKFLHDAIANHQDKPAVVASGTATQLTHTGFMCKCDNLVAESPFTHAAVYFNFAAVQIFAIQPEVILHPFHSVAFFFFEHRGPPIVNQELT